jgi:hypothetical protein
MTAEVFRSRLVVAVLCAVAVAACGPSNPGRQSSRATNPGGVAIFNNRSADDLITSIARSGLPVPNARNVTARDCPAIGCIEKVDTDAISIMKFLTTGQAELYAGSTQHVFQIADVVLSFAPTVPPNEQQQYEHVVTHEIQ